MAVKRITKMNESVLSDYLTTPNMDIPIEHCINSIFDEFGKDNINVFRFNTSNGISFQSFRTLSDNGTYLSFQYKDNKLTCAMGGFLTCDKDGLKALYNAVNFNSDVSMTFESLEQMLYEYINKRIDFMELYDLYK